jgi:predicted RNA-binding protein
MPNSSILFAEERRVCELVLEVPKIDERFTSSKGNYAQYLKSTYDNLKKTLKDIYQKTIPWNDREVIYTAVSPIAAVDDYYGTVLEDLVFDNSTPLRLKAIPERVKQLEITFPRKTLNTNEKVFFLLFSKLAEEDESVLGDRR